MTDETEYCLERSTTEAMRAIQSPVPRVAGVHDELCLLYTARALTSLAAEKRRRRVADHQSEAR